MGIESLVIIGKRAVFLGEVEVRFRDAAAGLVTGIRISRETLSVFRDGLVFPVDEKSTYVVMRGNGVVRVTWGSVDPSGGLQFSEWAGEASFQEVIPINDGIALWPAKIITAVDGRLAVSSIPDGLFTGERLVGANLLSGIFLTSRTNQARPAESRISVGVPDSLILRASGSLVSNVSLAQMAWGVLSVVWSERWTPAEVVEEARGWKFHPLHAVIRSHIYDEDEPSSLLLHVMNEVGDGAGELVWLDYFITLGVGKARLAPALPADHGKFRRPAPNAEWRVSMQGGIAGLAKPAVANGFIQLFSTSVDSPGIVHAHSIPLKRLPEAVRDMTPAVFPAGCPGHPPDLPYAVMVFSDEGLAWIGWVFRDEQGRDHVAGFWAVADD